MKLYLYELLKNFFVENRITKYEWESVKEEVYNADNRILSICTFYGSTLFCLLTIISIVDRAFQETVVFAHPIAYGMVTICLGILAFLSKQLSGKKSKFIIILVYCFYFVLYGFSVYSGIFQYPVAFATIYICLEFGFPLVFIEKTSRFFLISFFSGTIFCFLSFFHKVPEYSSIDIFYIICFYLLAFMPSLYNTKAHVREFHLRQKIEKERDFDETSGLLGKTAFFRESRKALEKSKNKILIILDLDNFKKVNDYFGHFTGDHVLGMVGECIRLNFRRSDIMGRFGGDEFLILVDSKNLEFIKTKAECLLKILNETKIFPNEKKGTPTIRASMGIAVCDEKSTIEMIFQRADRALYNAKKMGKNSIVIDNLEETKLIS